MYALYLTHWPALVLFATATGIERPDPLQGLLLLAGSASASLLIYHLVEDPVARFTRASTRRGLEPLKQVGVIAVCVALVLGSVSAVRMYLDRAHEVQIREMQGLDLSVMARTQHPTWRVRTYTAPGCYFHWPAGNDWGGDLSRCSRTWKAANDFILAHPSDMVFTIASVTHVDGGEELFDGDNAGAGGSFPSRVRFPHERTGTLVVGLRDSPGADFDPLDCAVRAGFDSPDCSFTA